MWGKAHVPAVPTVGAVAGTAEQAQRLDREASAALCPACK
jgi:hypothetical protein